LNVHVNASSPSVVRCFESAGFCSYILILKLCSVRPMYDFCQSKLKDTVDHINVIQKILFVFKVYI